MRMQGMARSNTCAQQPASTMLRPENGGTGGGATLTPFGAEVLKRYRDIHDRAAAMAADDLAALARRARPDSGPKI